MYPPPKGASNIPGLECSGTVVAVTEDCLDFKVGDKVCGILTGGGYAEYVPMSAMCVERPNLVCRCRRFQYLRTRI